jgi:hypothetical protein
MRRVAVHMQTTLNNRIANADGGFWEPFAWGEEEMAYGQDHPHRGPVRRAGSCPAAPSRDPLQVAAHPGLGLG